MRPGEGALFGVHHRFIGGHGDPARGAQHVVRPAAANDPGTHGGTGSVAAADHHRRTRLQSGLGGDTVTHMSYDGGRGQHIRENGLGNLQRIEDFT